MRKPLLAGILGMMLLAGSVVPVSAQGVHHTFGHHNDENHDCYITMTHFCEIGIGVCDGAGYCMDDHSRGYCNQSCQTRQNIVPDQNTSPSRGRGHHSEHGHHGRHHS